MQDVLGQAIWDYYYHASPKKLWIHNRYGPKEEMPLDLYFRTKEEMPPLELTALKSCKGKILDIGAGAGAHALLLQQRKKFVTALEISAKAASVMQERSVKNVIVGDVLLYKDQQFHTLLLLMNGIGLCGTLAGLRQFLQHAKTLLLKGGQLIFDSSDVAYLYDYKLPVQEKYYGEISYQYEYKKQRTDWFEWLYVDRRTLGTIATEEGWSMELLFEDKMDQYLVRLQLI